MLMGRASGVLLHPTSLPGSFGVGDLGPEAYRFVDWLAGARQRYWQMLPLNLPDSESSPYMSLSAFSGNSWLVSPERLVDDGLLARHELNEAVLTHSEHVQRVPFSLVMHHKGRLLERAVERFNALAEGDALRVEFEQFRTAQAEWLANHALFLALRERNSDAPWRAWKEGVDSQSRPDPEARRALAPRQAYFEVLQFLFARQWSALRRYARDRGIAIIGDLPIYVSEESADVWGNREQFQLDGEGRPLAVAGVPPDYFSETGQLWNNPLYDWSRMERDGYQWWIRRVKAVLKQCDVARLDHFRGFHEYWSIPAGETTAINGKWVAGPADALFETIRKALAHDADSAPRGLPAASVTRPELPFIAEDLGMITEEVHDFRKRIGLPGMVVLQFVLPDEYRFWPLDELEANAVVFTGTHDNDTTRGWFRHEMLPHPDRLARLRRHTSADESRIAWELVELAWRSSADTALAPLQDLLGLGSEARMNRPGTTSADHPNWTWRFPPGSLTADLMHRLADLTAQSNRLGPTGERT